MKWSKNKKERRWS